MTLQYVVGDKVVSKSQLMDLAEPAKREKREEKSFFKGWRVEGFKPGQIAKAQKDREAEIAEFDRKLQKDPTGGGRAAEDLRPEPLRHECAAHTAARQAVRAPRGCRSLQADGRKVRLGIRRPGRDQEGSCK